VRRLPKKARYDADFIYGVLDEARWCHVAAVVDGLAVALPTLHAREGDQLYLHGSLSNAVMKAVRDAGRAFLTVTLYDGVRVARSGFESSIAYRSVSVVGPVREVADATEKARVLDLLIDAVLPGRSREVRPMRDRERDLTLVLALTIDEASAKVSAGPTEDFDEDVDLPIWAGTVPARLVYDTPVPGVDGAMAAGDIPVPASVRALAGE
jgi:nitroimidazol reductase NimA-like FMN-containing flavoprotein (pyridoxamine 5'-phosphate oxidase superfamily)